MENTANRALGVVIADDEALICDLLKNLIQWDALGLRLLAVAGNGQALMQCIREQAPDIVITDICMPEMSGIDLIRQVREQGIACRFIIVSGYRQFEYAHNALRYDVESYLLKPIDGDELNETLRRTAESLRSSGSAMVLPGGRAGFRRLLMDHILQNAANPERLRLCDVNREFDTDFHEGRFRIAEVKLDMHRQSDDTTVSALTLTENIARSIVRQVEAAGASTLYCCNIDSASLLMNYAPEAEGAVMNGLKDGFDVSMHIKDLFIDLKMTMGVGGACSGLEGCADSRRQAMCALWCRIQQPDRRIIDFDELDLAPEIFSAPGLSEHRQRLLSAIDNLDESGFTRVAGDLKATLSDVNHAARIGILLEELCDPIAERLSALLEKPDNRNYLRSELTHGLYSAYSVQELESVFFSPIIGFIRQLRADSDQRARRPIRQAVAYMEENYNKPLKLDEVAAKVYLSPHYFSSLFISEIGQSFSDYLIGLRIETAKQLLRESGLSIGEIATSVGYQDARYFSRLFMQKVGIKPKEYRKIYG